MSEKKAISVNSRIYVYDRVSLRREILLRPLRGKKGVGQFPGMLIQTMLPYQTPVFSEGHHQAGSPLPTWSHTNGDITLRIESGYHPETNQLLGIPCGGTARLLISHIATEVVVKRSRHVSLGRTITALLSTLGLHRAGDRYREVRDQLLRLAFARISYIDRRRDPGRCSQFTVRQSLVADEVQFWEAQHVQYARGGTDFGGGVRLSPAFFEELLRGSMPVDPRVLVYFRKSPLTMDLYTWLTYKCAYMDRRGRREIQVSWWQLHRQFPAEYRSTKRFAQRARRALEEIKDIWPTLRYETPRGRLVLKPTRPHVPRL